VKRISNGLFKSAVNGAALEVEGNGTGGQKRNCWSMVPELVSMRSGVSIGFDVKLGKQGKFGERDFIILVTSDMLELGLGGEGLHRGDYSLNDIPIGFEGGVRYRIL
jgi:hypothetical protein